MYFRMIKEKHKTQPGGVEEGVSVFVRRMSCPVSYPCRLCVIAGLAQTCVGGLMFF